jgi:hypothetical protein
VPLAVRDPGVGDRAVVRRQPDVAGQRLSVDGQTVLGGSGQHHFVAVLAPLARDGRNSTFRVVREPVRAGAFKKGSPLAPAFQAAVNKLKTDGTYDRILKKWGTTKSAIEKSQISPPEIK